MIINGTLYLPIITSPNSFHPTSKTPYNTPSTSLSLSISFPSLPLPALAAHSPAPPPLPGPRLLPLPPLPPVAPRPSPLPRLFPPFFAGSASHAAAALVSSGSLSYEYLPRLSALIERAKKEGR